MIHKSRTSSGLMRTLCLKVYRTESNDQLLYWSNSRPQREPKNAVAAAISLAQRRALPPSRDVWWHALRGLPTALWTQRLMLSSKALVGLFPSGFLFRPYLREVDHVLLLISEEQLQDKLPDVWFVKAGQRYLFGDWQSLFLFISNDLSWVFKEAWVEVMTL